MCWMIQSSTAHNPSSGGSAQSLKEIEHPCLTVHRDLCRFSWSQNSSSNSQGISFAMYEHQFSWNVTFKVHIVSVLLLFANKAYVNLLPLYVVTIVSVDVRCYLSLYLGEIHFVFRLDIDDKTLRKYFPGVYLRKLQRVSSIIMCSTAMLYIPFCRTNSRK